jgi:branched-chain amino acid aminotransferase
MGTGAGFVDGRYCDLAEARLPITDPGLTRSDAVYDVVSVWRGHFFRLDAHIERFLASCAGWRLPCPYTPAQLTEILSRCVRDGGVTDAAYVSMALTRGAFLPQARAARDLRHTQPTFLAYATPYVWIAAPPRQVEGLRLIIAQTPRIPAVCVPAIYKNYHWGDLTRSRLEALDAGVDEAILGTTDGRVAEGAGFNVFFARDGVLHTPAQNVLHGITRRSVLELAQHWGIPAYEGDYPLQALREADEIFLTSTAGGILPAIELDGRVVGDGRPGPLSTRLREGYWQRREAGWYGTPVDKGASPARSVTLGP